MFKSYCDSCGKIVKTDSVGVNFSIAGRFGRHDFCVSCIKSIPAFLSKIIQKKNIQKKHI